MKILFISGGDSAHSHRWISWFLRQEEFEVGWISLRKTLLLEDTSKYKILPTRVEIKPVVLNLFLSWVINLAKIIFWRPDLMHIHYMGLNGVLGLLLPCRYKIFTAWGDDILFPKFPFILNLMIKRADLFTVDAVHMKERLKELGVDEKKIHIVNFGIETNTFIPKQVNEAYRQKLFKDAQIDDPLIISLRNHDPVYDIPTLIKSVPEVLKEIPNAKFAIGGSGPLTESYNELVIKLSVQDSVSFFGKYSHEELPHLFAQTTVYVSTSLSDAGIAASTAEAMSCQVPVVISNTGENDQWIDDTKNGFLFEAKDYKRLADLIVEVLRNEILRNLVAVKGREVIIQRNDYDNEMGKMRSLYFSYKK